MATILFHTLLFPPDANSNAYVFADLAEELQRRGHDILVLTTTPHYSILQENLDRQPMTPHRGGWLLRSEYRGIPCYHVRVPAVKGDLGVRAKTFLRFHLQALRAVLGGGFRCDVVLTQSPPLSVGWVNAIIGKMVGARSIYLVQDIFPDGPIAQGKFTNPHLVRLFRWIERIVYRTNSAIVCIAPGMVPILRPRIPERTPLAVIPNFVNPELYHPLPKDNSFARAHNLVGKFVVSYVGNIGNAHDLSPIFHAARATASLPIEYIVAGNGIKLDEYRQRVADEQLEHVKFLGYQPREITPEINAASDICLVMLAPHVQSNSFPSKIYTLMAMGRPILIMGDPASDASRLITDTRTGWALNSGDAEGFTDLVLKLYRDRQLLEASGSNGIDEVAKHYTVQVVADKYEALFKEIGR